MDCTYISALVGFIVGFIFIILFLEGILDYLDLLKKLILKFKD